MRTYTPEQRKAAVLRVSEWRKKNGRPYEYNANALLRYRRWRATNPQRQSEISRKHKLKARFGMTEIDYENLLKVQNFCCAICDAPFADNAKRRLHIDHDHKTGSIRGLLCAKCNKGIGHFGDDVELLRKAIAFLEFHAAKTAA